MSARTALLIAAATVSTATSAFAAPVPKDPPKQAVDPKKEAIYLLEEKAASAADPHEAAKLWKEAVTAWSKYSGEFRAGFRNGGQEAKLLYFDAFFEYNRCVARANSSLLKGEPTKLAEQYRKHAERLKELQEKNPDLSTELNAKFAGLLRDYPGLEKQYIDLGGKGFVPTKPPSDR